MINFVEKSRTEIIKKISTTVERKSRKICSKSQKASHYLCPCWVHLLLRSWKIHSSTTVNCLSLSHRTWFQSNCTGALFVTQVSAFHQFCLQKDCNCPACREVVCSLLLPNESVKHRFNNTEHLVKAKAAPYIPINEHSVKARAKSIPQQNCKWVLWQLQPQHQCRWNSWETFIVFEGTVSGSWHGEG